MQKRSAATANQKKRRVVVTGMGAVTPVGNSMDRTWNGIIEGVVNAAKVKAFDGGTFPTTFAYEVSDFKLRTDLLKKNEENALNRAALFGVNAVAEALEQAGIMRSQGSAAPSDFDKKRAAVCLGIGMASPEPEWFAKRYIPNQFRDEDLRRHLKYLPFLFSGIAARLMGARGGTTTIHTACASSGQSVGEAYEMVAYGDADIVLTGGVDSMINPFYFAGFSLLGALSRRNDDPKTASRSFDADRDGFVLGEGACMLVFEEYEHAKKRGAKIIGEICGYGITESAYRITDLHPEGIGPTEAMQMAIDDAGISPTKVAYVNAHGTSTHLNDKIEALAVSKVFPKERCDVHVSSTKPMTGHMISAAGAIEFAVALMALKYQVLPPTINVHTADAQCDVKLTPSVATPKKMEYALSNSVGFGGSNTALVCRRADAGSEQPAIERGK